MCGISGIIKLSRKEINLKYVEKMSASIVHRGRDDLGFFYDEFVGLAHNRLSIIDLSSAGHQPMISSNKRYILVFNGEIFNYHDLKEQLVAEGYAFSSLTDTEVLLNLWDFEGESCLNKLDGMYAFCIYDTYKKDIFLVRDRVGIKPLCFYQDEDKILFSSEAKAILETPWVKPNINTQGLCDYLHLQSYLNEKTLFKDINTVEPGHYKKINITENVTRDITYWDFQNDRNSISTNYNESILVLDELLGQSIKDWSKASVNIGSYISGGLDSSLVSTLASITTPNIKTFSSVFNNELYKDERVYSREVAKNINSNHHEVILDEREILEDHKDLMRVLDYPIAGYSAPYRTLSRAVRSHVKVVLTGHGGDEIFCGYPKYLAAALAKSITQGFLNKNTSFEISKLAYARGFERQFNDILSKSTFKDESSIIFSIFDRTGYLWNHVNPQIKEECRGYHFKDELMKLRKGVESKSFLKNIMYLDRKILLPSLLHVEDRTSMRENLESRTPFLSKNILEFSDKIPEQYFIHNSLKSMIRDVSAKHLPSKVFTNQNKSGIMYPVMDLFNKNLKTHFKEDLLYLDGMNIFNITSEELLSIYGNNSRLLWALWSLGSWLRTFNISSL